MSKGYHSLEIEINKIPKNKKEIIKMNFEKLHAQKIKWMSHGQNAFCQGFLYVNDNLKNGCNYLKMMH